MKEKIDYSNPLSGVSEREKELLNEQRMKAGSHSSLRFVGRQKSENVFRIPSPSE
jgi:hypothetical protein